MIINLIGYFFLIGVPLLVMSHEHKKARRHQQLGRLGLPQLTEGGDHVGHR